MTCARPWGSDGRRIVRGMGSLESAAARADVETVAHRRAMMAASVSRVSTTPIADHVAWEAPGSRRVDTALRSLDIVISGLALAILAPAWLFTAFAILVSSGRPILY